MLLKYILSQSKPAVKFDIQEYYNVYKNVKEEFSRILKDSEEEREFQISTVAKTIHCLNHGYKRLLIVKPTGVGKTVISRTLFASSEMRKALNIQGDRPLRLLFIANRTRLLQQAIRTYDVAKNIEIITISTSLKDFPDFLKTEGWDITCLDEAHHESMVSFQLYLESINNCPLIGLTATPNRPDGCILKFEYSICEITRLEAVKKGYIAGTNIISVVDTSGKNKLPIMKRVFLDFYEYINQTIFTFKTKREVTEFCEFLEQCGETSFVAILNQTNDALNDILDQFSLGQIKYLVNCDKINEGIDVKGCDTGVLARHYNSEIQLNQMIGRVARPDSPCTIIELINPLKKTLSVLDIVVEALSHKLCYYRNKKLYMYDFKNSELLETKETIKNKGNFHNEENKVILEQSH